MKTQTETSLRDLGSRRAESSAIAQTTAAIDRAEPLSIVVVMVVSRWLRGMVHASK